MEWQLRPGTVSSSDEVQRNQRRCTQRSCTTKANTPWRGRVGQIQTAALIGLSLVLSARPSPQPTTALSFGGSALAWPHYLTGPLPAECSRRLRIIRWAATLTTRLLTSSRLQRFDLSWTVTSSSDNAPLAFRHKTYKISSSSQLLKTTLHPLHVRQPHHRQPELSSSPKRPEPTGHYAFKLTPNHLHWRNIATMSSHVVVIATDLRRTTIKVTPGTYMTDVLQEACRKLNLPGDKYLMRLAQSSPTVASASS